MAALTPMSLELREISYRYAGSTSAAVTGLSLSIERGRVVGVAGPNGAGKSTLCLVAVGLAPLTIGGELDGQVLIDGRAAGEAAQHELAVTAGILFQEPETQLSGSAPTVWEEVAFGPRNLGLSLDEVVDRTWSAIEALAIEGIVERDPARLSGGQAQLVALAAVLALRPDYLVLDEPTSQLDPEGTRLVADAVGRAARQTGAGVLIVEHKADLLARLCDEIVVLGGGRVAMAGPAGKVLADPTLEALGVMPPARTRLAAAAAAAGLELPAERLPPR
jgi:energy-coupling factor transport system ATP-binding protein